ncbi:hypothetical protein PIB30_005452 [Stylosanthes scabra]|uniref:Lethal giant larvae (Lgl)-like C-terminal domain-containing protein n=1 Tax=Stylosanthes scabra TaxID=79078 RepID=A0ABU6Y281_9FABA|nr:hypothetical protein [Stylosanthes scabra]
MLAVKKLVEKASIKKPGGNSSDGLKASDVDPRLLFHNGVPSSAANFAYDNTHMILAISTKDGRIKLYGKGNSQALLESTEPLPSKFLQFIQNQGILINVTSNNHIEVWDIDKKLLSDAYIVKEEITSFALIQHSLYMYIGYSNGDISVLKIDQEPLHVVKMQYSIPLSASYGNSEVPDDTVVTHILPQPAAESKRVLIIFRNGQIVLWDIRESKTVFKAGGNSETKKVSSACWSCPFGSKVVVGYNNGEIFIWSIPSLNVGRDSSASVPDHSNTQSTPLLKLNLGYKSEKISIGSMKWIYAEGKASRLYVMGDSDNASSSNSLQVVLLNDNIESRTIKLGLNLSECCVAMEMISASSIEQSKHRQESLVLIGKSGHIYQYDDGLIERYLIQSQSKSSPSLPLEVTVKLPFGDSSITASKFISNPTNVFNIDDEYYKDLMKNYPPLITIETNQKDSSTLSSAKFTGFSKVQNLYITGHSNGAINFWDASCPLFIPILQLKQQSENDFSLSGIPLTALFLDSTLPLLVSGDQSGTVRLFRFKQEPYTTNSFMSLTGGSKKGTDHIIQSVKVVKTDGAVLSMNINHSSTLLAVGSDQGHVSVFSMDGPTLLYQKNIASEISAGIVDLQFLTCSLQGFEKNILAVGTKDSSVLALDSETGNTLGNGSVHPKKPSRALFMQVLGSNTNTEDATTKQSHILLCSEKALYVYSLVHAVQGIKKVLYKKKFHSSSCCWASTFHSNDDIGLMLLFTNGKLELRSLPELSLIVETSIRGFNYSPPKLGSFSDTQMCCSSRGDLVLVNGDQEIFVFSTLIQSKNFRLLDSVSTIYSKERMASQEELVPGQAIHKEKKKGIFSSVIKDLTGGKEKHAPVAETEDSKESIQELAVIFSNPNFTTEADNHDNLTADEDDLDLNIDDIDIDDHEEEKHKEQNKLGLGALNKKKLAGKFNALKGKLKEMKGNMHKTSAKEEQQEEQAGTVDQIKKKYGFSSYSSSDETSAAKLSESKLRENLNKLQGINVKTTEMQDTAKSFSSLANQVLRTAEQDRRSS